MTCVELSVLEHAFLAPKSCFILSKRFVSCAKATNGKCAASRCGRLGATISHAVSHVHGRVRSLPGVGWRCQSAIVRGLHYRLRALPGEPKLAGSRTALTVHLVLHVIRNTLYYAAVRSCGNPERVHTSQYRRRRAAGEHPRATLIFTWVNVLRILYIVNGASCKSDRDREELRHNGVARRSQDLSYAGRGGR